MNDRFGICKKNDESQFNPLNDPVHNVYGVPKILYSDILTKNKKKYPELKGNNINFPEYLKIKGLNDNYITKKYNKKYIERRKIYPNLIFTSRYQSKGKKVNFENNKKKLTDDLAKFDVKIQHPFLKKYEHGYNIINNRITKSEENNLVQNKYFTKIAELNIYNDKIKRNIALIKLNNNHRLNDGIYDYLKEKNYV